MYVNPLRFIDRKMYIKIDRYKTYRKTDDNIHASEAKLGRRSDKKYIPKLLIYHIMISRLKNQYHENQINRVIVL